MTEKNHSLQYEYQSNNIEEENELDDTVEYIENNNDSSDDLIYNADDGICIEDETIIANENSNEDGNISKLIDNNADGSGDDELYLCGTCNIHFKDVDAHIQTYHSNQSVIIDSTADYEEEIISSDFISTSKDDLNLDNNSFVSDENTNEFISSINETDSKEFLCKQCDLVFDEDILLKSHINAKHINLENTNNDETNVLMESLGVSLHKISNEKFECSDCNMVFSSVRSLKLHSRVHNTTEDSLDNTKCSICNTVFSSARSLKLHARMHKPIELKNYKEALGHEYKKHFRNIKYFKCPICEKRFDCKLREEHKKFHQNDTKLNEFVCTKCNKKFLNETSFQMHLKLHESQTDKPKKPTKAEAAGISLPYACQYCGREFGRPHEKVKHERIHTGEKPFKCEVCGKCFRVTYSLTLHLRTHTAARPYVCSICNKRFKSYSVYSHHLLTHSDKRPYKCPDCPKTFKTSVQLHGHKNSHTKPFNCPECNRPFATMYAVKTHMETHKKGNTNLKQRCLICGATYSRIFALTDHMREIHNSNLVISDDNDAEDNDNHNINNIITEEEETVIEDEPTEIYDDEVEISTQKLLQEEEITISTYETEEYID